MCRKGKKACLTCPRYETCRWPWKPLRPLNLSPTISILLPLPVDMCPCYRCYFIEDIKARSCKPQECETMDSWIALITSEVSHKTPMPKRPRRHKRRGYSYRMKHPQRVIQYAKDLSKNLSCRDVAKEVENKFNIKVSHVTILKWVNNISQKA